MNNNNVWGIVLGVLVILVIIGGVVWYKGDDTTVTGGLNEPASEKGEMYIGVTDATADIKNVNDITLEIEKVEVYSETEGWVEVSAESRLYNLLELKSKAIMELYGSTELNVGIYDRVRVTLGDVIVKTKKNGEIKAVTPGSQLVFNLEMNVAANQMTYVMLDLLADKSLHSTSDNRYVFVPVVQAQSQSGTQVAITDANQVTVTGGTLDSSSSVGMDLSGASRMNFNLITDNKFKATSDTIAGTIRFTLGGQTFVGTTEEQNEPETGAPEVEGSTNTNTNTDTNSSGNGATIDVQGGVDVNVNPAY